MSEIIDDPDAIAHFRLCQVINALSLEVSTGMSHSRGSVMNHARVTYGVTKRTKAGVLAELRHLYLTTYGIECQIGNRHGS